MPIDFHAPADRDTYGGRDADASWRDAVRAGLDPAGLDVADVRQPPGRRHPRGYLFEVFPRLLDFELARRPDPAALGAAMRGGGFQVSTQALWELRAVHPHRDAYLEEIRQRRGRSILHELDDRELARLVDVLADRLPAGEPVVETDRWTLWTGALPA